MNLPPHWLPVFAQVEQFFKGGVIVLVAFVLAIVFIVGLVMVVKRYTKVGPNEVLVISGRRHRYIDPDNVERVRGFRIVKGGGTFVVPVVEKVDILSLELLTI